MATIVRLVTEGQAMRLLSIDYQSRCHLMDFFNEVAVSHEDNFARMMNTMDRIASGGPLQNAEIFKELRDEIWQIKVGVLRVLCFHRKDGSNDIVCTNGFVKAQQKTPIKEINLAKWLRANFLMEDAKGNIRQED